MANGEPYPMGATRWRAFCSHIDWTTPDKGPCLWRPMQHMNQQSCFDGIDANGTLRMKTGSQKNKMGILFFLIKITQHLNSHTRINE